MADLHELATRWEAEAARHASAADEHFEADENGDDEERLLHLEVARVLRNCAKELRNAHAPNAPVGKFLACAHCPDLAYCESKDNCGHSL
jgi:hypothetical protein